MQGVLRPLVYPKKSNYGDEPLITEQFGAKWQQFL